MSAFFFVLLLLQQQQQQQRVSVWRSMVCCRCRVNDALSHNPNKKPQQCILFHFYSIALRRYFSVCIYAEWQIQCTMYVYTYKCRDSDKTVKHNYKQWCARGGTHAERAKKKKNRKHIHPQHFFLFFFKKKYTPPKLLCTRDLCT